MQSYPVLSVALCSTLLAAMVTGCSTPVPEGELPWNKKFDRQLSRIGKDNWVVITDAAYPARNIASAETIVTPKQLTTVLDFVLDRLGDSDSVLATAWISAELERIPDRDAPDISRFHKEIRKLLNDAKVEVKVAKEEEILKKFEGDAAAYKVLLLRTTTPLPYSAVYLHLDSKYWDEAREKRLRDALRSAE